MANKITFGLTGNICSGKSTIAKTFYDNNIITVDADMVARQVVELGTRGLTRIMDTFGGQYLQPDGTLDRAKLGELVFTDKKAMTALNGIMGPLIEEEGAKQIKKLHDAGHLIVGWNAAILCEAGNADKYRPLIVAHCTPEQQLVRLMKRGTGHGPLTREQAMSRINSQMPAKQKMLMADFVIDTSSSIEESIKQTQSIIEILKQSTK